MDTLLYDSRPPSGLSASRSPLPLATLREVAAAAREGWAATVIRLAQQAARLSDTP